MRSAANSASTSSKELQEAPPVRRRVKIPCEVILMVLYVASVIPGSIDFAWQHVTNNERQYWVEADDYLFLSNCYKVVTWLNQPMPHYFNLHIIFSILFATGLVFNKYTNERVSQRLHSVIGYITVLFGLVIVVTGGMATQYVHSFFQIPLSIEGFGILVLLIGVVVTGHLERKSVHVVCVQCLMVSVWISVFVGVIQRVFQYFNIHYLLCKCSGVALAFLGVAFVGFYEIHKVYARRKRLRIMLELIREEKHRDSSCEWEP